ncbi:hypothetical protein F0562_028945 [Nyssa sinensis]|uniref:PUM-HD domain-containing protein n=1 Tax=Nyssa sinensis TaxID=561372 RepID=A0A5J5B3S8_9ASTE|nr:hypothetical protein F0562_028945 [Nyssa sinensis]
MFGRVGIENKIRDNMKDDEELEMLLGEIPHATSLNLHQPHTNGHHVRGSHSNGSFVTQTVNGMMYGIYDDDPSRHYMYKCASPGSGLSLKSDGSSSSLLSGGYSLSDNGSPTPPPLEELKPHMPSGSSRYPNGLWMDSRIPDSPFGKKASENLIDELNLSRSLSRMDISDEQENFSAEPNGIRFYDRSIRGTNQVNSENCRASDTYRTGFSDHGGFPSSVPGRSMSFGGEMSSRFLGLQHEYRLGNLLGSQYSPRRADVLFPQSNCPNSPMSSPCDRTKQQANNSIQRGIPPLNLGTSINRSSVADALLYARRNDMNLNEERDALNLPYMPQLTHPMPHLSVENILQYYPPISYGRTRVPSNIRTPQGGLEAFTSEDSLIIQGEGLNYVINKGFGRSRGLQNKGSLHEIGAGKPQDKRSQLDGHSQFSGICENGRARTCYPFSLPLKCNSLAEAQGYIYLMAKDQHGCRFLQRIFDDGTPQDVQIIFNEIIDHVVELMMNPFGNYLMQKLLEVCKEEQRMQILLMVTEEPGELIRISLNTHGTRVVQKLIETLKTRQQISLVISALEPGFPALIKDLNGNHVVQRCLQCLSSEENKFIFVAAAKYCVEIATHQHGCCVLQRCISRSTGEHRETLVAEISENGLLLAQDAFGNYVVQLILELKIPSATSNLISQFEGNYVHLSTQKFSSHVVEKCLVIFNDEVRSKIIHELLSASHFEHLLQDPHANYVVQTALRVSEGTLHNSLVNAIESYKAISRNSPYSKRIFSQKVLKK